MTGLVSTTGSTKVALLEASVLMGISDPCALILLILIAGGLELAVQLRLGPTGREANDEGGVNTPFLIGGPGTTGIPSLALPIRPSNGMMSTIGRSFHGVSEVPGPSASGSAQRV